MDCRQQKEKEKSGGGEKGAFSKKSRNARLILDKRS
jgi:hypothetical protein